jgi:hypothetical protein
LNAKWYYNCTPIAKTIFKIELLAERKNLGDLSR